MKITREELKTTFTIQQVLVVTVVIIALLISKWVGAFYQSQQCRNILVSSFGSCFFLIFPKNNPLDYSRTTPVFQKLVIPQIVETVVFSVVAVYLAVKDLVLPVLQLRFWQEDYVELLQCILFLPGK